MRIWKTVIQVTVLTEGPYEWDNLHGVAYDIARGDALGTCEEVESTELPSRAEVAEAAAAMGGDPGFFYYSEEV